MGAWEHREVKELLEGISEGVTPILGAGREEAAEVRGLMAWVYGRTSTHGGWCPLAALSGLWARRREIDGQQQPPAQRPRCRISGDLGHLISILTDWLFLLYHVISFPWKSLWTLSWEEMVQSFLQMWSVYWGKHGKSFKSFLTILNMNNLRFNYWLAPLQIKQMMSISSL